MNSLVYIIGAVVSWPLLTFLISLSLPKDKEKWISGTAFTAVLLHLIGLITLFVMWFQQDHGIIDFAAITLYKSEHMHFYLDFYFDKVTAVYAFVGVLLTFLVTTYSRTYMHRESGYKRFFNTILLFYFGYTLTIFSGNLETLFVGWEILGITSFLLIAFYRERYLPVKNAYKVYSIYRIGDVGLILAMWASHHLWHDNITFQRLLNYDLVHHHLESHSWFGFFIGISILTAACAKSAQFPFSSWLPRAMEGPTPSSAIFYGSLSVHLGAFLLMRTMPFWEQQISVRILIFSVGLFTALLGASIGRVQSSIKSQIAYASVAQIGLIFIELSFGLIDLALVHFAGNAFLRTYQLLVSPSAVSYLIREQFYHFEPLKHSVEHKYSKKWEYSLYMLSLKEYNMDALLDRFLWTPFKNLGKYLRFINIRNVYYITIPTYLLGLILLLYLDNTHITLRYMLPILFAGIGLLFVFRAYAGRINVFVVWTLMVMSHFWIVLSIAFNDGLQLNEVVMYLAGVNISGIVGFFVLKYMKKVEPTIDLNRFQGHVFEYPKMAALFLFACLGLSGFPITTTFIGEDILFSHIGYEDVILATFLALSFVISGIGLIRMFSRIFLGPHIKRYHAIAQRSS